MRNDRNDKMTMRNVKMTYGDSLMLSGSAQLFASTFC